MSQSSQFGLGLRSDEVNGTSINPEHGGQIPPYSEAPEHDHEDARPMADVVSISGRDRHMDEPSQPKDQKDAANTASDSFLLQPQPEPLIDVANDDIVINFADQLAANNTSRSWLSNVKNSVSWNTKELVIFLDVGTSTCTGWIMGAKYFYRAPTMVFVEDRGEDVPGNIKDFGYAAEAREEKCQGGYLSVRIMQKGYVTTKHYMMPYLEWFVRQLMLINGMDHKSGKRPTVVITHYTKIIDEHRRIMAECAMEGLGAINVLMGDQVMMAALGFDKTMHMRVLEPDGCLAADFGDGTSQAGVISDGGFVEDGREVLDMGGFTLTKNIQDGVLGRFSVEIGTRTAIKIKHTLGSAMRPEKIAGKYRSMPVSGSGDKNQVIEVNQLHVFEWMDGTLGSMSNMVKKTLRRVRPEQRQMCLDVGMFLNGGATLMPRFDRRISEDNKIPVLRAADPLYSVPRGMIRAYNNPELRERVLKPYRANERHSWSPLSGFKNRK